jgi:uncharacterized protein (DUF4415 family)
MRKKGHIVRTSAREIDEKLRRGESQTDWAKVKAMTEAELEASIAADPDDVHEPLDWTQAVIGIPPRKEAIKLRIDEDVVAWFRATGKGYQTRMNAVLRTFMESQKNAGR